MTSEVTRALARTASECLGETYWSCGERALRSSVGRTPSSAVRRSRVGPRSDARRPHDWDLHGRTGRTAVHPSPGPPMQQLQCAEEPTVVHPGRLRVAWRAAHEPVAGVPRRIRLVAYAVPLVVLPSSIWRLPAAFGDGRGLGERAYVVFLSILSEAFAFAAIGLIARWGEAFPRWIPLLRGRRVPRRAAVLPATVGAASLTVLFTLLFIASEVRGTTIGGGDLPARLPRPSGRLGSRLVLCLLRTADPVGAAAGRADRRVLETPFRLWRPGMQGALRSGQGRSPVPPLVGTEVGRWPPGRGACRVSWMLSRAAAAMASGVMPNSSYRRW